MNEKEIKKYKKYLEIKNKKRVNWISRIRYWKYLKRDYSNQITENYKKNETIHNLKLHLTISNQLVEQLQSDLNKKKKK